LNHKSYVAFCTFAGIDPLLEFTQTRRKILAGAAVLNHALKNKAFKDQLVVIMKAYLTRPDYKGLFGME
jgi:hypothetical protein